MGGSGRRRSSMTSDKKEGEGDLKPLRRSTREREPATPASPVGSPKAQRTRRRARGLPVSAQREDTIENAADVMVTPARVKSTGRATISKSARKQQTEQHHLDSEVDCKFEAASALSAPDLMAAQKNGKALRVKLIVDGQPFSHSRYRKNNNPVVVSVSNKKLSPTILGQDGNLFFCVVCRGFGDVVCCDMCPHVYHPECVPHRSESRRSLVNDDDPWYCPECTGKKTAAKQELPSARFEGSSRRTIKHRCQECQQTRSELSLKQCDTCAVYIHHPPCRGSTPTLENTVVLCSSCRAEAALTEEEQELHAKKKHILDEEQRERKFIDAAREFQEATEKEEGKGRRRTRSMDGDEPIEDDAVAEPKEFLPVEVGADVTPSAGQKRKKRDVESPDTLHKTERKRKRKKKKKRKRDSDAHLPNDETFMNVAEEGSSTPPLTPPTRQSRKESSSFPPGGDETSLAMQGPPTQATPAFHFYLAEQRPKIEKLLARKHRYFNRLPKGGERNALIAKEAAMQWVKLNSVDQKKYINMSMHDYESRIIAWKEEKNIRDMLVVPEGTTEATDEAPIEAKIADDHILTHEMHERLYLGTSVGSKPYKPEPDQSHNRVLLDLLRDMRFHPLPMFSDSRPGTETAPTLDSSKLSIQHFDVQGPIATSVGDECLGCTRGWPHFCPVLQRRIPAVEHRSKLQPAASALISTRVGLGLRPRLERIETEEENNTPGNELLVWKEAPETRELRHVRFVPSGTLSDPSSRADDIVEFIEEVLAMKIPVPPRPPAPSSSHSKQVEMTTPKKSVLGRGVLPTRQKRTTSDGAIAEAADNSVHENINKCGRCRTIIMNESGCVQCRRAQLVINTSKKQLSATSFEKDNQNFDKSQLLKVQTAMLGRVITKEVIGENQADSDKKISAAILRELWSPCAVMSPKKTLAPSPSRGQLKGENSDGNQVNVDNRLDRNATEVQVTNTGASLLPSVPAPVDQNAELRPRNRRSAAAPALFESTDADRISVARQHREEADKINKRTLSIACHGILLALMRRDPLLLFAQPVTAEGYAVVVKKPTDFSQIRNNVLENSYHSLGAFVADVRLLCENALIFNPPGSIYSKTAKEILDVVVVMQRRASKWISAIKNSHSSFWRKSPKKRKQEDGNGETSYVADIPQDDPFKQLRQTWPEAVTMYESNDWVKTFLTADFSRTRENETAFYGGLAVRRAAKAAEGCLAPYTDAGGVYAAVVKRTEADDEELRQLVDSKVAEIVNPIQLREIATGREETIVRLMRTVQSRRLERRIGSENGGCARCDGTQALDQEMKAVMNADARWGRSKKKGDSESESRVASSRLDLTTGLASAKTRAGIARQREKKGEEAFDSVKDVCVSLRGSKIHGWGLFAEQPFKRGDVVAEYVGECVGLPVADAREKLYQEMRIKDYQFRLDDSQIIDATMKGGLGRYINHNCNPSCMTKILPGKPPNQHLRRVLILAQRDIAPREELTYDYQFPLELNLDARIPCNCQSDVCRGFMNWDLPEKGANTGAIRTQKRGANMRDRIRRLGRPLKK